MLKTVSLTNLLETQEIFSFSEVIDFNQPKTMVASPGGWGLSGFKILLADYHARFPLRKRTFKREGCPKVILLTKEST